MFHNYGSNCMRRISTNMLPLPPTKNSNSIRILNVYYYTENLVYQLGNSRTTSTFPRHERLAGPPRRRSTCRRRHRGPTGCLATASRARRSARWADGVAAGPTFAGSIWLTPTLSTATASTTTTTTVCTTAAAI